MVVSKGVEIKVTDDALDALVEKGFDPKNGARPLQRVIDKDIKRPLSRELLFGNLKNGGSLTVDYNTELDKFVLETENVHQAETV